MVVIFYRAIAEGIIFNKYFVNDGGSLFKIWHTVLGTHLSSVYNSELVGFVSLLFVNRKEKGVVAFHLLIGHLNNKNQLWVEAVTKIQTQYLPTHWSMT